MNVVDKLKTKKFAVAFIILIAASLIIATVIPQKSSMSGAELFRLRVNYPGFSSFISFTGLDHIYTAWWFLGIIFFFL